MGSASRMVRLAALSEAVAYLRVMQSVCRSDVA